ncbi:Hypothetical protein CAP_8403 [Chondromyces apiculatus DSM 436]|uniref:Uncharacterized protein n=1 Tax=Chondromyces apiculatus DSM 436 TaxID=1192034 RepID=A0A017SYI1_9BACT|nr:Hypothetical protein CAP_8403 [Chondromyces apiculatus DSM 436]
MMADAQGAREPYADDSAHVFLYRTQRFALLIGQPRVFREPLSESQIKQTMCFDPIDASL